MMDSLRGATQNTMFEQWLDATMRPPMQPTPTSVQPPQVNSPTSLSAPHAILLCQMLVLRPRQVLLMLKMYLDQRKYARFRPGATMLWGCPIAAILHLLR